MVGEIGAALSALKSAFDLTKSIADVGSQVTVNDIVIKLQSQILSAQQSALAAQERIQEMDARLRSFESWENTASRYKLVDFGSNTFAWQLKEESSNGEPSHRVCPKCFEDRRRSVLQHKHRTAGGQDLYVCVPCATEYFFGAYDSPPINRINRNSGWV